MGKTAGKVQRTAMPETTTKKQGRTSDIGFATSLRLQDKKHQCGKASKPKEGGRQQPRNKADLFKGAKKGGPLPPHSQLPGQQRFFRFLSQTRHIWISSQGVHQTLSVFYVC